MHCYWFVRKLFTTRMSCGLISTSSIRCTRMSGSMPSKASLTSIRNAWMAMVPGLSSPARPWPWETLKKTFGLTFPFLSYQLQSIKLVPSWFIWARRFQFPFFSKSWANLLQTIGHLFGRCVTPEDMAPVNACHGVSGDVRKITET